MICMAADIADACFERIISGRKGTEQMRILIVGGVAGGASVAAQGQETGCPV